MSVQGMDWDTLSGKPYLSSLFQSLVPGSLQSLSPFRCLCHTANLQAVHHWFNWLLYPKWKLNLKAVMFEVTPSTILFYFHVPDLTSVTWYLPFQQERFAHSCLPEAATDRNQQAAFISSAQKKHTCFPGEPPRKCNGLWSAVLSGNSKSHWYHIPSVSRLG